MAEDSKVLSEITMQQEGRNPFAIAQLKAQQGTPQTNGAQFVGDPFSPQGQPPMQNQQVPQNPQDQNSQVFQKIFQAPGQGQTMEAGLMQNIGKLDIDVKGISLNPLGKQLLMGRLQKRWGDKYQERNEVKSVLSQFDKALAFYSDEVSKSMNESASKAQRTLAALRG